jgi:DNA-binding PucR family transcriptional regulator
VKGHERLIQMRPDLTIADLVEGLGYELAQVETAPGGLDVVVGDPVIHDRLAGNSFATGDVVLAVGLDTRGRELLDLLESSGAAGAAAVIVKLDDDADPATARVVAERAGVALVRVTRDVEWGQLHALARMVTSTGQRRRDGGDPSLGDLFGLANAIALRAQGPVTIEDAQSRVLAYSSGEQEIDEYRRDTILGRRVPESWVKRLRDDGVFDRIWRGDGPVRISYADTEPGYRDRLVVAVRAGGEVLGSIWIQEGNDPLGDEHERLLGEVAPMAALHLVRHFSGDVERRQESELLRAVLDGRMPASALADLVEIGRRARVFVLGLQPVCTDDVEAALHVGRLSSVVSLYRRAAQVSLALSASGGTLYVVLAAGDRLNAVVDELVTRARSSVQVPVKAALASAGDGFERVAAARAEVDDVLVVCDASARGAVELSSVMGPVILERWRRAVRARPDLIAGRMDALVAIDREKDTQYVPTLRSFLDHFGDVVAASAALGVHANTYRYRLKRAIEVAGLDFDDPIERLVAHLQLRLLDPEDEV